jgi:hypothetical protein
MAIFWLFLAICTALTIKVVGDLSLFFIDLSVSFLKPMAQESFDV